MSRYKEDHFFRYIDLLVKSTRSYSIHSVGFFATILLWVIFIWWFIPILPYCNDRWKLKFLQITFIIITLSAFEVMNWTKSCMVSSSSQSCLAAFSSFKCTTFIGASTKIKNPLSAYENKRLKKLSFSIYCGILLLVVSFTSFLALQAILYHCPIALTCFSSCQVGDKLLKSHSKIFYDSLNKLL